jgi:prepilin-type N-terminal cleavage/methylation domain-containing protein
MARPTGRRGRRARAGFTLLEVVVAALILAIGLSLAFELISVSLRGASAGVGAARALDLARGRLEELLSAADLRDGADEGETQDGFRWTSRVRYAGPADLKRGGRKAVLYELSVRVTRTSGRERAVELVTLRAVPRY